MSGVRSIGAAAGAGRPVGAAPARHGGFRLPEAAAAEHAAAAAPVSAALPLLALQEAGDAAERDRRARRRGEALLADLGALQLALLEGRDPAAILGRLEALAAGEAAADPHLAGILDEVRLRAKVEAARRGIRRPPSQD
ncbi:MAG: flagellar assembly protein FliX [Acetobacteraceae bacterium]